MHYLLFIYSKMQLTIGFLLRERPVFAVATVATVVVQHYSFSLSKFAFITKESNYGSYAMCRESGLYSPMQWLLLQHYSYIYGTSFLVRPTHYFYDWFTSRKECRGGH